jgi:hypothetical protein
VSAVSARSLSKNYDRRVAVDAIDSVIGYSFTALIPKIDLYSYFFTLGITPMFLFSGIFLPFNELPSRRSASSSSRFRSGRCGASCFPRLDRDGSVKDGIPRRTAEPDPAQSRR